MEKKGDKRFGLYSGQLEVQEEIEVLRSDGYPSDNIYVIAKDNEQINGLRSNSEVQFSTEQDGGWIDNFRGMFPDSHSLKNIFEEMGFSRDESENYNNRIENGEIFLYADDAGDTENRLDAELSSSGSSFEPNNRLADSPVMSRRERRKKLTAAEEESLYLHEERLEVDKERVQTGEVNVNKRIVKEQQQVDVPVERDEVVVERRQLSDNGNSHEPIQREPYQVGDELHIPVIEEQLIVTKKEVVTEEIVVTRRKIQDIEHVSETLRREEVEIDERDLSNTREKE